MLGILPYVGNKQSEIKFFDKYLDNENIKKVYEPFCGSCSVSLYLFSKNNNIKSFCNDIDNGLINFYKQIQDKPIEFINEYNKLIPECGKFEKNEYEKIIQEYKKSVENNIYTFNSAVLYFFFNKIYNVRRGLYPINKKYNKINIDNYKTFFDWLKNTTFSNLDYIEFIKDIENKKDSFIFLDPPYFNSINTEYKSFKNYNSVNTEYKKFKRKSIGVDYFIVDNTKIFTDILDILKKKKNKTLLIINKSCIIEYLYKKYIKEEYIKLYRMTKKKTFHLIVSNYNI